MPVLIVTALDSMSEKITALGAGAKGLYSKPFHRVHLVEQIETLNGFNKNQYNEESEEFRSYEQNIFGLIR